MTRGNITTTFHANQRVTFSCPDNGYCIDDLDVLLIAIRHARLKLLEQEPQHDARAIPQSDFTHAYDEQQSRLAAPS